MVRDEIPDPPKPSISPPNPGQVKNCFHKYVYPRIFCTIERTASAANWQFLSSGAVALIDFLLSRADRQRSHPIYY